MAKKIFDKVICPPVASMHILSAAKPNAVIYLKINTIKHNIAGYGKMFSVSILLY